MHVLNTIIPSSLARPFQGPYIFHCGNPGSGDILTIEIGYIIGEQQIRCSQLILITPQSINAMKMRSGEEAL